MAGGTLRQTGSRIKGRSGAGQPSFRPQPAAGSAANFTDVPADAYYAQAVSWAVAHGITTGVGGGRFDPNSTCTRAQIATFLYRLYLSR